MMKYLTLVFCTTFAVHLPAQQSVVWESDTVGGIAFEFPTPARSFDAGNARGLIYHEGNIFFTLTSMPDTSGVVNRQFADYRKYYSEVLAKAIRTLSGKLLEATDTTIGSTQAHLAKVEVRHNDGGITHYELMQVLSGDSLRAFSGQYEPGNPVAQQIRDRFFGSIHAADAGLKRGDSKTRKSLPWVWLLLAVAFALGAAGFGIWKRQIAIFS